MLLQANGKGDMGDANQLVSEMYIYKEWNRCRFDGEVSS